jgi:hypothetical protein
MTKNRSIPLAFLIIGIATTLAAGATGVQSVLAASASQVAPGHVFTVSPGDPILPGASQVSPGHIFIQAPPDPILPGASQVAPGHLKSLIDCGDVCPTP